MPNLINNFNYSFVVYPKKKKVIEQIQDLIKFKL